MSVLPTTRRSSLRIEITCISGVDGSFCEKEGSVPALSRDLPAMASVIPTLNWPCCGDVCWSWPLSLVWVLGGRWRLQANCALPKGLQQTVETFAPSHCVNICAFGFSQEETEAQISVLEVRRQLAHGNSLSKMNASRYSCLPHPRQLLPQMGLLHQAWGRCGTLPAWLQVAAVS